MKIIVVADTHSSVSYIIDAINNTEGVSKVIHLGDCVSDARVIQENVGVPVIMVRGNNDYFDKDVPLDKIIYVEGHKILLTHGHKYNVYFGPQSLYFRAMELGCDMVLYGHTHIFEDICVGDVRIINPGSVSLPRDRVASYVLMEITEKEINIKRIKK